MSDCKENVLEMIDEALRANKSEDFCTCRYDTAVFDRCTYCKISEGLTTAKACIVMSVDRIDIMRAKLRRAQVEIIRKLRVIVEE